MNPLDRPDVDPHGGAMSRRRFIARSAGTVAAFGVAAAAGLELRAHDRPAPWDPRAFPPPGEAAVAVLSASSYHADLEGLVHDGLRSIGADVRGARVLLKPNMVEYDPGAVINTDPRLVAGAISALRRLGATDVVVAEGPGHRRDTGYVVQASGLADATRDAGASFVDLNVACAAEVPLPIAIRTREHLAESGLTGTRRPATPLLPSSLD